MSKSSSDTRSFALQGDPIETSALRKAAAPTTNDASVSEVYADRVLSLGAVKALTGHLEGSAGLAGLAQALVVLQQRTSAPLRYRSINPYVADSLERWHVPHRYGSA